ncbi:MAG: ABC transporter ATP-binding protein [Ilumatobacteraceae bacterium]
MSERSQHTSSGDEVVLDVSHLSTTFFLDSGAVPAVRDVSFSVRRGEILGIVGESGSGKSITARSIVNLVPRPGRIVGGNVWFKGRDVLTASAAQLRAMRGAEIATVLQEPMTSLNPVMTVGKQVIETLEAHPERGPRGRNLRGAATDLLERVRISDAPRRLKQYPMHLSGGMRQRVSIAMAASCRPDLIVADEPTTALDVTIQAQVLSLLLGLRDEFGTAMILITHDMGVVAQVCDTVAVMYGGEIVEYAPVHDLFAAPQHPYTRALLRSLPTLDRRVDRLPSITGLPPNLADLPAGCPFAPRCSEALDVCSTANPPAEPVGIGRMSRCWLTVGEDRRG